MRITRALASVTALVCLAISSCSTNPVAGNGDAYTVHIGDDTYVVNPLTASTWTAVARAKGQPLGNDGAKKAALLEAIERRSGCKVTDSDVSAQGTQLDAQVDCSFGVKNSQTHR